MEHTGFVVGGDGLGQDWVMKVNGMGLIDIVTSKEPFFYSMEVF